jgi:hypothetical protein
MDPQSVPSLPAYMKSLIPAISGAGGILWRPFWH